MDYANSAIRSVRQLWGYRLETGRFKKTSTAINPMKPKWDFIGFFMG